MMDKEAIEAMQLSAAVAQANEAIGMDTLAALPKDFQLVDLEKYMVLRRRASGVMNTSSLADFAAYTQAHAEPGATVFVNPEGMQARAVLNLGSPDEPGHADKIAVLQPKQTAAYTAMLRNAGRDSVLSQQAAAEFLEDWLDRVQCFNDEGLIATPKAIAAIRKMTIESMRKLESAEKQHAASRSAFESVQATSSDPLPTLIYFETVAFWGLRSRTFALRVGIRTGGEKPALTLRIQNMEQHEEDMADELATLLRNSIKDLPVLIGTYTSK